VTEVSQSVLSKTASEMWATFVNFPSLLVVVLVTVALCLRVPWGLLDFDGRATTLGIFTVAGTIVALVLPAAEIANSFITRLADRWLGFVIKEEGVADETKFEAIGDFANELKSNLEPAWRASIYALCAFVISSFGMLVPQKDFRLSEAVALSLDRLFTGLSLGFLIVGALWFFPAARYAFRLETIDRVKSTADKIFKRTAPIEPNRGEEGGGEPGAGGGGTKQPGEHSATDPPPGTFVPCNGMKQPGEHPSPSERA
jgi:hypothetical protein